MTAKSECNSKKSLCRLWPFLLGPAAMAWVYIAHAIGKGDLVSRGANEDIALILVGISVAGFGIQAIKYRQEFQFFMLALCAAFFCREWHFAGTSNGIYVALVLLAVWAVMRKDQLGSFFSGNAVEVWAWTAFSCYLLSQLIARRVFRYVHLPSEEEMHIFLEESVETMAHIVMIITCIISWVRAAKMKKST
ncbi:MAG: hypothetical protein K9M75_07685 [Phycisphaerae bacterium]|nr:hypothetical protein [Phycisphaerae bacterium]